MYTYYICGSHDVGWGSRQFRGWDRTKNDLDTLEKWPEICRIKFNKSKYKVLNLRWQVQSTEFKMEQSSAKIQNEECRTAENDLGG